MADKIAGIDVHKKVLMVVVMDATSLDGNAQSKIIAFRTSQD